MTIPRFVVHENPYKNGSDSDDEPGFTVGNSIAWLSRQQINHSRTLLGKRYLCRGGGMLVVAPSGQGKSTFSIQASILWSCGKPAFGINANQPLRILIVQAEDDQGDCTEMSAMINHLELKKPEYTLVDQNTEVIRCNHLSGEKFVKALRKCLENARDSGVPFDLVIINPYSTYLGKDVMNFYENSFFLNNLLNPVLTDLDVGIVVIHHMPKTKFVDFDKLHPWDWQYAGAGSAALTNWARAIIAIVPQSHDDRVFMFVAAKRGKRLSLWENSITRYFKHSEPGDVLRWDDTTDEEKSTATDAKKQKNNCFKPSPKIDEIIKQCVSLTDWRTTARIHETAVQTFTSCGLRKVEDAMKQGVIEDSVSVRYIKNPKGGRPYPEYVRNSNNNNVL